MSIDPLGILATRTDLKQYGSNALLLFTLQLKYDIDDIHTVAESCLTDGSDDKKCDLVYIDRDLGVAIIAQGYFSTSKNVSSEAPRNKATDLNAAVSWLLASDPASIKNEAVKNAAYDLSSAIMANEISRLEIWYSHNLTRSKNVATELRQVELTAKSLLERRTGHPISVSAIEIDINELRQIYESIVTPILVDKQITVKGKGSYQIEQGDWKAIITAVPAVWLQKLYIDHGADLFSANVRGYLGSRNSDANINNGIKFTAESDPAHFWAYNNGITAVTNSFRSVPGSDEIVLNGLSIVNGAQTTGALGSIASVVSDDALVPARFIVCSNADTIRSVIQYNNSQNRVEAPDFRSNDQHQRRIVEEFKRIPESEYLGGRRGGSDDVIRRRPNLLSSAAVAQALTAFHGDPQNAYNRKSALWSNNALYDKVFNAGTTARHIVLAYSLQQALIQIKTDTLEKVKIGTAMATESAEGEYFRLRGSIPLAMAAIGACMEILAGRQTPNLFQLSFGEIAPDAAKSIWLEVLPSLVSIFPVLSESLREGMKGQSVTSQNITTYRALVSSVSESNRAIHEAFRAHLTWS